MSKRILIVDDEEELCMELKEVFIGIGFDVDFALDGQAGLELIEQGLYDLVILDLRLPKFTGYEVLKLSKQRFPDLKIIIFSGYPLEENPLDVKNGIKRQEEKLSLRLADLVISKPIAVPMLIEHVQRLA